MEYEEKRAVDFLAKISKDLENNYIDSFLVNIDRTKKSLDIVIHMVKEQEILLKYLTN